MSTQTIYTHLCVKHLLGNCFITTMLKTRYLHQAIIFWGFCFDSFTLFISYTLVSEANTLTRFINNGKITFSNNFSLTPTKLIVPKEIILSVYMNFSLSEHRLPNCHYCCLPLVRASDGKAKSTNKYWKDRPQTHNYAVYSADKHGMG